MQNNKTNMDEIGPIIITSDTNQIVRPVTSTSNDTPTDCVIGSAPITVWKYCDADGNLNYDSNGGIRGASEKDAVDGDDNNDMSDIKTHFQSLTNGYISVVEFWTTRCVRCPRSMSDLDRIASTWKHKGYGARFISVCCMPPNTIDAKAEYQLGAECIENGEYDNITHVFADMETKQRLKQIFSFTSVPHLAIIDANGVVQVSAPAKKVDLSQLQVELKP